MTVSPAAMRVSYDRDVLLEDQADPDPIRQFAAWFEDAAGAGLVEPNAMTLATVDATGRPTARTVLLKGFDGEGFVFYTNLDSRKSREMAADGRVALLFFWDRLHRQVRVDGIAERGSDTAADDYFASRPYGSRIGAWSSPQSRVIAGREELEASEQRYRALYPEDQPVPRPPHWGGWLVRPETLEFWQGRPSRLHDRLLYCRDGGGWNIQRLAP